MTTPLPAAPLGASAPVPTAVVRLRRGLLLAGLGLAFTAGLLLAAPFSPALAMEPDRVLLLRGMAAVKGGIAVAVALLLAWRLSRPIERPLALAYGAALGLSAAAVGWLWSLWLIPIAALVFYSGLAIMVLIGRHDLDLHVAVSGRVS